MIARAPKDAFAQRLDHYRSRVDNALAAILRNDDYIPERLRAAMQYSVLGGGKRVRPLLVYASGELCGLKDENLDTIAAAVELVHAYSLVHDDLPAMDNDDLRRGRPTTHKAFDEATAILAGDGLLTLAFDILSREETHPDPAVRVELVCALARAAGLGGMVGGQILDLAAEGRFTNGLPETLGQDDIETLEAMKTGALLRFACVSGAILGQADREARRALERYGAAIGKAFQIADDLLDAEGDPAMVGKATHKDAAAHKATFVRILGADGARKKLVELVADAEAALAPFGTKADVLKAAARFVAERRH